MDGTILPVATVLAQEFPSMNWVMRSWGSRAIISAGLGAKDQLREAIQIHSPGIQHREIFAHTGWRRLGGENMVFLHAEGAIGTAGLNHEVRVSLGDGRLGLFRLPQPPIEEELRRSILASLSILDLAPHRITVPLLSAIYRAPLGEALTNDFALFNAGRSGVFKSVMAGLAQAHFGSEFNDRNLPANWSSSENSIERQAFLSKDVILVVDDFAPRGNQTEVAKLHQKADRLFRNIGNRAGRDRLNADMNLRQTYFPRGLIIATGEDIPKGQSLRARTLITEIAPGEVNVDRLSALQNHAREGFFAKAMAAYLQWLAPQMGELKQSLPNRKNELRARADANAIHRRTPDTVANLILGFEFLIRFAESSLAITADQTKDYLALAWNALEEAANCQARYQTSEDPCYRFVELLTAAIISGQAHIADAAGNTAGPPNSQHLGWTDGTSRGFRVGWLRGNQLLIDPDVALQVVNRMIQGQADSISLTKHMLGKQLADKQWILSEPEKNTVKRKVKGFHGRCWVFPNYQEGPFHRLGLAPPASEQEGALSTQDEV